MDQKFQSVKELAASVAEDKDLANAIKADPVKTLAEISTNPLETDALIYRIVVGVLGASVIITLLGYIAFTFFALKAPEAMVAIGAGALGALAGLLAPSPVSKQ